MSCWGGAVDRRLGMCSPPLSPSRTMGCRQGTEESRGVYRRHRANRSLGSVSALRHWARVRGGGELNYFISSLVYVSKPHHHQSPLCPSVYFSNIISLVPVSYSHLAISKMYVCVCVCACVRACMRACVCVPTCVRVCVQA